MDHVTPDRGREAAMPDCSNRPEPFDEQSVEQAPVEHRDRQDGPMPDAELGGSSDSLYRRYATRVRAWLRRWRRRGLRESELADCEQEVWRRVLNARCQLRLALRQGGVSAWFRRLTYRVASDTLRHEARHATEPLDSLSNDVVEQRSDAVQSLESYEIQERILDFVAKLRGRLSEASFQVFRLRAIEGCNEQQAANALGLTPKQVRYRFLRARKKVRLLAASYLREWNLLRK